MSSNDIPMNPGSRELGWQASEVPMARLVSDVYESASPAVRTRMLSQLVAKVYEAAAPDERSRMLVQLLRPLGVLSLVVVANGIFAKMRFRSGWPDMGVQLEDAQNVRASDVIALVNHVQQVSVQAVDGLAHLLAASPVVAGSAAAALLMKILMQRAKTRRATDNAVSPPSPI